MSWELNKEILNYHIITSTNMSLVPISGWSHCQIWEGMGEFIAVIVLYHDTLLVIFYCSMVHNNEYEKRELYSLISYSQLQPPAHWSFVLVTVWWREQEGMWSLRGAFSDLSSSYMCFPYLSYRTGFCSFIL